MFYLNKYACIYIYIIECTVLLISNSRVCAYMMDSLDSKEMYYTSLLIQYYSS